MLRLETPERASAGRVVLFLVFVMAVFASARGGAALVLESRGLATNETAATAATNEQVGADESGTSGRPASTNVELADRR